MHRIRKALALAAAAGPWVSGAATPPFLLVAEAARVVREYRLSDDRGMAVLESSRDTLRVTISGRKIPLNVAELLRLPGTRLRETALGIQPDNSGPLYLLIPCGTNADRTGPQGAIVVTISKFKVTDVQSGTCVRRA